mmetsp:Transcript_67693/g.162502  ORF Transcript_67693/g.162502 Transcript_67693/m.162502 type:complete len:287 (-) Transcript_67693:11-871(-)
MVFVSQLLVLLSMVTTLSPVQLFHLPTQLVFISILFGNLLVSMSGFTMVVLINSSFFTSSLVFAVGWVVNGNSPIVSVCVHGFSLLSLLLLLQVLLFSSFIQLVKVLSPMVCHLVSKVLSTSCLSSKQSTRSLCILSIFLVLLVFSVVLSSPLCMVLSLLPLSLQKLQVLNLLTTVMFSVKRMKLIPSPQLMLISVVLFSNMLPSTTLVVSISSLLLGLLLVFGSLLSVLLLWHSTLTVSTSTSLFLMNLVTTSTLGLISLTVLILVLKSCTSVMLITSLLILLNF